MMVLLHSIHPVILYLFTEHTLIVPVLLQAPLMTIAANAGVDGSVVVGKLLEQDNLSLGYDAAKGLCSLTVVLLFIVTLSFYIKIPWLTLQIAVKMVILILRFAYCSGVC
jgi:hypothetical protein